MRKHAASPIQDHPLITKLNASIPLDEGDLAALAGLLERRVIAKKAKDIIVEGYEYKVLHVVESDVPTRYKPLHSGKRQIRAGGTPHAGGGYHPASGLLL